MPQPSRSAHAQPTTPDLRASVFNEVAKISDRASGQFDMIDGCEIIICIKPGVWYEYACHICGANSNLRAHFFQGLRGLWNHLGSTHLNVVKLKNETGWEYAARTCIVRTVGIEEVRKIKAGDHETIEKEIASRSRPTKANAAAATLPSPGHANIFANLKVGGSKRAADDTQVTESSHPQKRSKESESTPDNATREEIPPPVLSEYCECNICGHNCLSTSSRKKHICLVSKQAISKLSRNPANTFSCRCTISDAWKRIMLSSPHVKTTSSIGALAGKSVPVSRRMALSSGSGCLTVIPAHSTDDRLLRL